jgi:hypothetical protein
LTGSGTCIDAPYPAVVAEQGDAPAHAEWATEFFAGPIASAGDGTYHAIVPRMGGPVRLRLDTARTRGHRHVPRPEGGTFGPPLPIRVLTNGDGADVLFTLARFPGTSEQQWTEGTPPCTPSCNTSSVSPGTTQPGQPT